MVGDPYYMAGGPHCMVGDPYYMVGAYIAWSGNTYYMPGNHIASSGTHNTWPGAHDAAFTVIGEPILHARGPYCIVGAYIAWSGIKYYRDYIYKNVGAPRRNT